MNLEIDWEYKPERDNRKFGRITSDGIRRLFRVPTIPIKILIDSSRYSGVLLDISAGGMAIETSQDLSVDIEGRFIFSLDHYRISVIGRVVNKKDLPGLHRCGILFLNLDEMASDILKSIFLSKLRR